MNESTLADRLARAGLVYFGLAGSGEAYIPPALASFGIGGGTVVAAIRIAYNEPQKVEKFNAAWLRMCQDADFFDADGRFLVGVKIEEDEDAAEDATLWWAVVALADLWDLAGRGAAELLGHEFGLPSFTMLSMSGELVLRASREQDDSSGLAMLRDLHLVPALRRQGEWLTGWHLCPEATREAVRNWLDAHPVTG